MEKLLLGIVNGGWQLAVANTDITFDIPGATLADQAANVDALATAMQAGWNETIVCFEDTMGINSRLAARATAEDFFQTTDGLILEGESIIDVDAGSSLMAEIVEVGEALAEALM